MGLSHVGGAVMGGCALVVAFTPLWQLAIPASLIGVIGSRTVVAVGGVVIVALGLAFGTALRRKDRLAAEP